MVEIKQAIVVEGRYDTIRLRSLVEAVIVQTNGFRLFKDREAMQMLRRLAAERGLVVLTDSDAAGFQIRDHIASCIPPSQVIHAYIPPVAGKEARKTAPSKEGLLGVEGMRDEALLAALSTAGVLGEPREDAEPFLDKARLYEDGLTGGADSKRKREALCRILDLPTYLSSSRLCEVVSAAYTEEEYRRALVQIVT